jgi:hypothetical protein
MPSATRRGVQPAYSSNRGRLELVPQVWAEIVRVIDALGVDTASRFKVRSGEHLAVVLASAFLGGPPIATDLDGGPDLVFDLRAEWRPALTGRREARFADVEVKSLPGPVRAFDAAIERALARGEEPRDTTRMTQVVSAELEAQRTDRRQKATHMPRPRLARDRIETAASQQRHRDRVRLMLGRG